MAKVDELVCPPFDAAGCNRGNLAFNSRWQDGCIPEGGDVSTEDWLVRPLFEILGKGTQAGQ
jgi:hypothetical protein